MRACARHDRVAFVHDDNQIERVTRRACPHHLGAQRIEGRERLSDCRVLAQERPWLTR